MRDATSIKKIEFSNEDDNFKVNDLYISQNGGIFVEMVNSKKGTRVNYQIGEFANSSLAEFKLTSKDNLEFHFPHK